MSDTTTLADLIARLEAATGPAFVLDEAIMLWRYADAGLPQSANPLSYTASIDDAMTLVPEGWHAVINARPDWPTVELHEFPLPCRIVPLLHARTPALALCIAALKARSQP
jgi:hypothetical protein